MLAAALLVLPGTLGIVTWDESSHPCNGGFHDAGPGGSALLAAMSYDALWSVPKAVACLESMPLNTDIRDTVVSNIERGIGQAYTYADIAHDSSKVLTDGTCGSACRCDPASMRISELTGNDASSIEE